MNAIKLILIIGAILGMVVVAATSAIGATITWNRDNGTNNWHHPDNWDLDRVPLAGDDVVIGFNSYTVVISSQDAACKTLDIGQTSTLEITGKALTLGDSDNDTTSTLGAVGKFDPGIIRFVKSGGNVGVLKVHKTVTFTGGGNIVATLSTHVGRIERASGTTGIVINADNAVIGNITFYCDVNNKSTDRFETEFGQTMVFGGVAAKVDPAVHISGNGNFYAAGKMQFTIVTFASTAPDWFIQGGEMEVTDDADSTHWVDVPFDVDMAFKDSLLDLQHDFSCTGQLTVWADVDETHTITVASGKVAKFNG